MRLVKRTLDILETILNHGGEVGLQDLASMTGLHISTVRRFTSTLAERGYLYQTLMRSGAVVINGTDPPVEDINPIANFYCSVTRKMPDGALFFPEQRLTRQQALESYTVNGAYAAFKEETKGTLAPGKLADITVLSRDIMTIPDEEILSAKVVYTIIGGEVKYRKD